MVLIAGMLHGALSAQPDAAARGQLARRARQLFAAGLDARP